MQTNLLNIFLEILMIYPSEFLLVVFSYTQRVSFRYRLKLERPTLRLMLFKDSPVILAMSSFVKFSRAFIALKSS